MTGAAASIKVCRNLVGFYCTFPVFSALPSSVDYGLRTVGHEVDFRNKINMLHIFFYTLFIRKFQYPGENFRLRSQSNDKITRFIRCFGVYNAFFRESYD